MTEIRFIIGTGRSGTRTMFRMFTGADEAENGSDRLRWQESCFMAETPKQVGGHL